MLSDEDDSDAKDEDEGVETTIAKQIFDQDDGGERIFFILPLFVLIYHISPI